MINKEIDLDDYAEGAVMLDGFEDCIIGVVEEFGNGRRLLYDKQKMINKLCSDNLMTEHESEEFFIYNILGLHVNKQNALFLDQKITPVISEGHITYSVG
jgi:hypothetical protein